MHHLLLCNRLGNPRNPCLGQRIVDLARITIEPAGTRDHDNTPALAILDAEKRRRLTDNLERRRRMQIDNGMPLLVRHLVNHAVPRVPRVVDEDVDLATAKLSRLVHERLDVVVVEHVAHDGEGAPARALDG